MLNMFQSKQEINHDPGLHCVGQSEARKKLRWLASNPPQDLARIVIVSPAMAEAMLERNADDEWHNRPNSEKGVARYARSMQAGKWKMTGEPIIFSKSGRLINGQHRLMACIKSGASFRTLCVFGIDDDAFKFMDIGIARTASHIFAIESVPNYNYASSVARLLYGYTKSISWDGRAPEVENDALLEFYHSKPAIQKSHYAANLAWKEGIMVQRWAGLCHYVCAAKSREQADEFFDKLTTGIGLSSKSNPIYLVRKRLLENARSTSDKLGDSHVGAFVIQAWNAYRRDGQKALFRWRTEQSPNEAFPRAE